MTAPGAASNIVLPGILTNLLPLVAIFFNKLFLLFLY